MGDKLKSEIERYVLSEDVIVYGNEKELHVRKGVWNFKDVAIDLQGIDASTLELISESIERLRKGEAVNLTEIEERSSIPTDLLRSICKQLIQGGFLIKEKDKDMANFLSRILGFYDEGIITTPNRGRLLLFSDLRKVEKWASELRLPKGLRVEFASDELFKKLSSSQSDIDPIVKSRFIDECSRNLSPFSWIGCFFLSPSIFFLRNLSNVCIQTHQPFTMGFVDGPFLTIASFSPPETGCFSCFEERHLSRMKSLKVYHDYLKSREKNEWKRYEDSLGGELLLDSIRSLVIHEGISLCTIGKSRLMGRVLNIHLPTFEIQFGNLLRVPYCPSCGYVAKSMQKELYVSSSKVIEEIMDKIEVGEDG